MNQQQIVVGGSWLDLLQQAQRMAQQFNDNAIPAFLKIIDGLSRLPQAQLQRGDFLLAGLRSDAAVALEAYLCSRGRVADALAVVQRGMTWPMHPDDLNAWEVRALQMHLLLKQTDAASAIVHRRIAAGQNAVSLLSELAELQIWFGLPSEAEQTIVELERAVNRTQDPAAMRQARATLAWTRTRLALQQGKWNDALAWYEHCCTLEAVFRDHGHVLYEQMVRGGQVELALRLIDGERKPMRAALWRGLAHRVLAQTAQAHAIWLNAATTSLTEQKSNPGFVEWIHCFYYRGDPKGEALTMLLTAQREETNLPWDIHLATALGSALRNNMDAAHLQMRLATRALRINLDGLLFPTQSRYHFDNLLSAEQMAELQPYFINENTIN